MVQNETTDLLRSKWAPPRPRPGLVARPALLAQLESGLDRRLTLIAAPAGFGKTTLVSQWLATRTEDQGLRTEQMPLGPQSSALSTRLGWLALDSGDAVVGHLGMSGQMLVLAPSAPPGPHLRVRFAFADVWPGRRSGGGRDSIVADIYQHWLQAER